MVRRALVAALVAGLLAGLAVTWVQLQTVVPLVLQAETYEDAGGGSADPVATLSRADAQRHDGHGHEVDDAWQPEDGLERTVYTAAGNTLTAIGFSLLLLGCFTIRNRSVDSYQGALWGLAGFGVFSVAPALGLPPELPGVATAELADRQLWWLGTVVATAAGLAFVVFFPQATFKTGGVVLIVLPHVVGAPESDALTEAVPPELSARFVSASLGSAAVLWLLVGGVSGWLYGRWVSRAESA